MRNDLIDSLFKDPVCGMTVLSQIGLVTVFNDQTVYFCSEYCKKKFLEQPESYLAALVAPSYDEARENRLVAYFANWSQTSQSPAYSWHRLMNNRADYRKLSRNVKK